jgi:eukaryotic-like serine/threonine-protein kinase
MFCVNCGNSMTPGGRFCFHCGAQRKGSGAKEVADQDPLIGRTIDSRYHIDAKLGAGGMGAVYRATRLLIGDVAAVKILHSEQVENPEMMERFRREAQAAARLKHPNAVAIYDFGVSGEGLVYLVMELVEGENLRAFVRRRGPLNSQTAGEIISQACAALDEAHRFNIVHRDIKPDNIVVTTTPTGLRVKVLDFGIAKLQDLTVDADHLTQPGAMMGTPHYMSPEQCLGEEIDGRSDIYSLGIVLYEMLTGTVPFNSLTPTAIVVQQVTKAPPSLRTINNTVTPAVEAVVLRALEKQPQARPQTAGALMQELTAAITGVRITQPVIPDTSQINIFSLDMTNAPEVEPITQFSTPISESITLPGPHLFPRDAVTSSPKSNRLMPLLIAAFLVLIIGGGVAAWLLVPPGGEMQTTETQTSQDSSGKTPSDASPSADNTTTDTGSAILPEPPAGMAYVPGGEFLMGSDTGDEYERPQHSVIVNPFFIDLNEVTNEEYEEFIEATGHKAPPSWANGHHKPGTARRPVTGVDWDDAKAYAEWKGKRLPTEEEWEFAARGTDGRRFPWGDQWKPQAANAASTGHAHPDNVGGHPTGLSPFGAFDMVGNVWEWTASDFTPYSGGQTSANSTDESKVVRGGSYRSRMNEATTTVRRGRPARGDQDYGDVGIRCAKDATP